MSIYSTKTKWQTAIQPIVSACVRHRVHPDAFTYGALGLSGLAAVVLARASDAPWLLWLVPVCVLARLLLNLMDGQVARALGVADAWGEAKNEFGDRLAMADRFAAAHPASPFDADMRQARDRYLRLFLRGSASFDWSLRRSISAR